RPTACRRRCGEGGHRRDRGDAGVALGEGAAGIAGRVCRLLRRDRLLRPGCPRDDPDPGDDRAAPGPPREDGIGRQRCHPGGRTPIARASWNAGRGATGERSRDRSAPGKAERGSESVMTTPFVIRPGAAKPNPFTIVVIANPAIQAPRNSATFVPDPILGDRPAFDACQDYIEDALFGRLANQVEPMLGVPGIATEVRMLGIFDTTLPVDDAHAFVAQDNVSDLLIAR